MLYHAVVSNDAQGILGPGGQGVVGQDSVLDEFAQSFGCADDVFGATERKVKQDLAARARKAQHAHRLELILVNSQRLILLLLGDGRRLSHPRGDRCLHGWDVLRRRHQEVPLGCGT